MSLDAQGRLYAVERTCTEPLNPELAGCQELTRVVQLLPERRVLAMSFADGRPLGGLKPKRREKRRAAFSLDAYVAVERPLGERHAL